MATLKPSELIKLTIFLSISLVHTMILAKCKKLVLSAWCRHMPADYHISGDNVTLNSFNIIKINEIYYQTRRLRNTLDNVMYTSLYNEQNQIN